MSDPDIHWEGQSGKSYGYWIAPIDASFKDVPGNYIFAKETKPNQWRAVYIGQAESLKERLSNHEKEPCARRNGATHIHNHTNSAGENARRAEETDLIRKWSPVCND